MDKLIGAKAQGFLFGHVAAAEEPPLRVVLEADVLARDLNLSFRAACTLLVRVDSDEFIVIGAHGAPWLERAVLGAISEVADTSLITTTHGACGWHKPSVDGTPCDLYVAIVQPADGRDVLVASLFDPSPDLERRNEIEFNFAERQRLAASFLELTALTRSRRERKNALEQALSTMRSGIVLLNDQARVVFANAAASLVFNAADCLKVHRGRLLATNLRDNVRLTVALQHVADMGDQADDDRRAPMLTLERTDRTHLIVLALPIQSADAASDDAVTILHIVDPKIDFADHVRPICRIYRLSRTETDLACLLAKGLTLSHAADILRLKEQTARSSLRSIFFKTGTGRQTELVLLLLSHIVPTSSALTVDAF